MMIVCEHVALNPAIAVFRRFDHRPDDVKSDLGWTRRAPYFVMKKQQQSEQHGDGYYECYGHINAK
jgi:hypothetical protein